MKPLIYTCFECKRSYEVDYKRWRCDCGGVLNLNYGKNPVRFRKVRGRHEGFVFKYVDSLPFEIKDESLKLASMGEGNTPLIHIDRGLYGKADYLMPTLSFKDRGSVVMLAAAKAMGVKKVVEDSSGNAGASIAAYSARLGFECDIFVPEKTSAKKILQIEAYGANVHRIRGTRADVTEAAIDMVESIGCFYASHVYNPMFQEGTKTYVYELFEQLDRMPDTIIVPVGNGTLLCGAVMALREMLEWNLIDRYPNVVAVQVENCSPIARSFAERASCVTPIEPSETVAEGIAIANPARGHQILQDIYSVNGQVVSVNDEETLKAQCDMALQGIYVELTSAVSYAAYMKYVKPYPVLREGITVLPLCGSGLKC